MINSVHARNFMGRSFDVDLSSRIILCGPNGCGKTAVTSAMQIAILGYVPGADVKSNPKIHEIYATGNKMVVGVKINGRKFARTFNMVPATGTVSCSFHVGDTKASKGDFSQALGSANAPSIFDLKSWVEMSDNKQAEQLFSVYPPGAGLEGLASQLEAARSNLNSLEAKRRTIESHQVKLTASMTENPSPTGTVAEVRAEIEKAEQELATARYELAAANIEAEKAAEAAKKKSQPDQPQPPPQQPRALPQAQPTPQPTPQPTLQAQPAAPQAELPQGGDMVRLDTVLEILSSVASTMEKAGCEACAARLVLLRGLSKIKAQLRGLKK